MSGTKGKSGGAREGSGPKRNEISDAEVQKFIKAAKRNEKVTGETMQDYTVRLATQTKDKRTALAAQKMFYDVVIIKHSEKDVNVKDMQTPHIYVPKRKEDPALKLIKKGK